jgi:hypothetical protein
MNNNNNSNNNNNNNNGGNTSLQTTKNFTHTGFSQTLSSHIPCTLTHDMSYIFVCRIINPPSPHKLNVNSTGCVSLEVSDLSF